MVRGSHREPYVASTGRSVFGTCGPGGVPIGYWGIGRSLGGAKVKPRDGGERPCTPPSAAGDRREQTRPATPAASGPTAASRGIGLDANANSLWRNREGAPPILNTFTKPVSPQGHDTVRSSVGVWTLPRLPPTVMATAHSRLPAPSGHLIPSRRHIPCTAHAAQQMPQAAKQVVQPLCK